MRQLWGRAPGVAASPGRGLPSSLSGQRPIPSPRARAQGAEGRQCGGIRVRAESGVLPGHAGWVAGALNPQVSEGFQPSA